MASYVERNENALPKDMPLSQIIENPPNEAEPEEYTSFESKYNRTNVPLLWPFLDFLCIAIVGIPIIVLYVIGVPYHRGFYCNDESINKPHKASTVENYVAILVGLILPGLSFILVETLHYRNNKGKVKERVLFLGPIQLNGLIIQLSRIVSVFLFGAAVNVLMTDIGKYTVGRLRPYFLSVCKPDTALFNCTSQYITANVCTGDPTLIRKGRLSFPSGHSSFAAYTMVFLVLYLEGRVQIAGSILVKPLLQLLPLVLAILCGLSRISDYRHHWTDVLSGLSLGTLVAFIIVCFILDKKSKQSVNKDQV